MKRLILAAGLLLGGCGPMGDKRQMMFDHCIERSTDAYACAEAVERIYPQPGAKRGG
jgi:hypothetical protein